MAEVLNENNVNANQIEGLVLQINVKRQLFGIKIQDVLLSCYRMAITSQTQGICQELKEQGHEEKFRDRTGLLLDPYLLVRKLKWILDHVEGAREKAANWCYLEL